MEFPFQAEETWQEASDIIEGLKERQGDWAGRSEGGGKGGVGNSQCSVEWKRRKEDVTYNS